MSVSALYEYYVELATREFMDRKEAEEQLRSCSSTERIRVLIGLLQEVTQSDWWQLFYEFICICDTCYEYSDLIKHILKNARPSQLKLIRPPQVREVIRKLPATVEVYRGGYDINKDGFSWTLNKEVARKFAGKFNRYQISNLQAKIFTGRVKRDKIATYLDDREEEEIISAYVKIIGEEIV